MQFFLKNLNSNWQMCVHVVDHCVEQFGKSWRKRIRSSSRHIWGTEQKEPQRRRWGKGYETWFWILPNNEFRWLHTQINNACIVVVSIKWCLKKNFFFFRILSGVVRVRTSALTYKNAYPTNWVMLMGNVWRRT